MAKQPTAAESAQEAIRAGKQRQAEAVRLQEERDKATPTPTQEENDLARLGALDIDQKQADGSEEQPVQAPDANGNVARTDAGSRNRQVKTD